MPRIDIVISNPRHHCEMATAVARNLRERGGYALRVLSLCEFRGTRTPDRPLGEVEVDIVRLSDVRRPRGLKPKGKRKLAGLARALAWRTLLSGNLKNALRTKPDLVILFNDAAFPYDRFCRVFRKSRIPFLLLQEGIRFETASDPENESQLQGRGGASAIAVFGQSSAEFFLSRGAPRETIHLTGNPRFDGIRTLEIERQARAARAVLGLRSRTLLFLSNPIEFFGHCTKDEKLRLVQDFVLGITSLFSNPEFRLVIKLHGHEDPEEFRRAVSPGPHAERILIDPDIGLYPLFEVSNAAVMFGTTAGLEALLFDLPLGVLAIPGVGFLHDYVKSGAATGLRWDRDLPEQVTGLLDRRGVSELAVKQYLDRTLAVRDGAAERVGELVERLSGWKGASGGAVSFAPRGGMLSRP